MKLMPSSVAPLTRASLPTRSSPPQHARTGKLYVSQNPIAGFIQQDMVCNFLDRNRPYTFELFFEDLDAFFGHPLLIKSPEGMAYNQIKTALVQVAKELENSTTSHLILSSDRLTLHLGEETISLPLDAKSINNVNNWPNKIGKHTQ